MSEGIGRSSPSGEIVVRKLAVTIPAIAVGASSTGLGTIAFAGAATGQPVTVSPRASLGNVGAPQAFVSAEGVVSLIFATGGAALTIATQVFDVAVGQW